MASNSRPFQHLRSEHEEADTHILLHAADATQRGATSIIIQSPDRCTRSDAMDLQETLSR